MLDGSILKQLIDEDQGIAQATTPLNFGVYYKNTLVALCHALEDCILATESRPLVVTAFQQGKWYLEEADRYHEIAQQADQIVIMAAPDGGFHDHPTGQLDNVHLVDLDPSDPVAQEWHLMILAPDYTAMVLCQELSVEDYGPQGPPENDLERKFYGFWTFDPALVHHTVKTAVQHLGKYRPELQSQLASRVAQSDPTTIPEQDWGAVVSRIVKYLQESQDDLGKTTAFELGDALDQNLVSNELQAFLRMAQLVDVAEPTNPLAAAEVASLADMVGQLIDLPGWRLNRLRLASLLHRITPRQDYPLTAAEEKAAPSCPLVPGAQVMRTMPRLRAVARIITHLDEHWDGSGQPAGIEGDDIPLESRVLGLVIYFQQQVASAAASAPDKATALATALAVCQQSSGTRWDPKLVDLLALLVSGLQQGLSLPSIPNRMTLTAGLLDPGNSDLQPLYQ
jgi:DICT domain-containing protein